LVLDLHRVQDADNIEDAIKHITGTQPGTAVGETRQHCHTSISQLLLQYLFVMNLPSPQELWLVYGFLERVMGVKPTVGRSVHLTEFCQHVLQSAN